MVFSDGAKLRIAVPIVAPEYGGEQIAYDGTTTGVGKNTAGKRSILGEFLVLHGAVLKEGLFGGTMTIGWPLLKLSERQPTLEYKGLTKGEGTQYHVLAYRMKKGQGDCKIELYFDPDTFRHVRTEYSTTLQPTAAALAPGFLGGVQEQTTRLKVAESFTNFEL